MGIRSDPNNSMDSRMRELGPIPDSSDFDGLSAEMEYTGLARIEDGTTRLPGNRALRLR
jgi:hypothetical protein